VNILRIPEEIVEQDGESHQDASVGYRREGDQVLEVPDETEGNHRDQQHSNVHQFM